MQKYTKEKPKIIKKFRNKLTFFLVLKLIINYTLI